jgi:peptide/nickel transport system permease protein
LPYITGAPERLLWPAVALSALVLSINYIGDALRDAFNPHIRGRLRKPV